MAENEQSSPGGGVLVIVAHPDDAEFMAAGSIARWVNEGRQVNYLLCTSGDKGTSDPTILPADLAVLREREQRAACDVLGVGEIEFLGHEDGVLEATLELRREIVRSIRRFRPDIVVCQDPTTRWSAQQYLNHPDHRAAGSATLDAVYPSARDPLVFPELLAGGFAPHKVIELYIGGSSSADTWIDISSTIETKIAALRKHESQVGPNQRDRDIGEFIRERARTVAEGQPMEFAEAFKYLCLG